MRASANIFNTLAHGIEIKSIIAIYAFDGIILPASSTGSSCTIGALTFILFG
jgi:hypothetical protein